MDEQSVCLTQHVLDLGQRELFERAVSALLAADVLAGQQEIQRAEADSDRPRRTLSRADAVHGGRGYKKKRGDL